MDPAPLHRAVLSGDQQEIQRQIQAKEQANMPYINQALPVSSDAPGSDTLEANGVKHIIVNGKGRPNGDAKKNLEEHG
jgi:hypothetical protein